MPVRTVLVTVIMLAVLAGGCARQEQKAPHRLQVVTTLFPLYDFARFMAGDAADVTLLLPPGVEPHSFEPRPNDLARISKAGLFIYTGSAMEPWAQKVIAGIGTGRTRVVEAGREVSHSPAVEGEDGHDHGHDHRHDHGGGVDPHIWLDFDNAALMVDAILAGLTAADPPRAAGYRQQASLLKERLKQLDGRYRSGLAACGTRTFLHGGHYTFGYLARRYGLDYTALSGISSDAEPSAAGMAAMVRTIRSSGVRYIFAEELLSPRLTRTLAGETGVGVLMLHGAHNLGRDELQQGAGFFDLMEQNLTNLRKGLACR